MARNLYEIKTKFKKRDLKRWKREENLHTWKTSKNDVKMINKRKEGGFLHILLRNVV